MNVRRVPATLWTVTASNGDPLLLYGTDDERNMMLWPTPYIAKHKFAFARWSKRNVELFRGCRMLLNHPLSESTCKWAKWLGVTLEQGTAVL